MPINAKVLQAAGPVPVTVFRNLLQIAKDDFGRLQLHEFGKSDAVSKHLLEFFSHEGSYLKVKVNQS